ncbi:MAG: lysophospholipid acyltransferase family protein [Myxococcales bacterium]|nr:1-acyl-sn-glycerol-3-phosphate acyltransferase [Myxococcota bacterium]MDW8280498.1 lysophospholipid acyltransferase family protein [Myxococcales bacterium]
MLDLARLQAIRLRPRPLFQRVVGTVFLMPSFYLPFRRTHIVLEGAEHLPRGGAILIMNHTDRYNYWPLQYKLWRLGLGFTATWVKGKYYEHPLLAWFMDATNNIPVPSKGYLLSKDFSALHRRLPDPTEYAALRRIADGHTVPEAEVPPAVRALLEAPCPDVPSGRYLDGLRARYAAMMRCVVALSRQALEMGLHLLIFPEGTRSRRLGRGRTGAAQMALYTRAPVVPVGCNGSDLCYPGDSPLSRGGVITYRIGAPMRADGELAPFQIPVPFEPFTPSAEPHQATFQRLTDLFMDRINALLDPPYQYDPDAPPDEPRGAERFL